MRIDLQATQFMIPGSTSGVRKPWLASALNPNHGKGPATAGTGKVDALTTCFDPDNKPGAHDAGSTSCTAIYLVFFPDSAAPGLNSFLVSRSPRLHICDYIAQTTCGTPGAHRVSYLESV